MSDNELINKVKLNLGITSEDEDIDSNIRLKINAVKGYLINGGAKLDDISDQVISCISIGVNDLLNNKAGDTKFSPAFNMLALQICRR